MYQYTITKKEVDDASNIVITVLFEHDTDSSLNRIEKTWAFDLTDERIDAWARARINVFTIRDTNLQLITLDVKKAPAEPDQKVAAVQLAQIELNKAIEDANLAKLAGEDAGVATALVALKTAQAAVIEKGEVAVRP